MKIGSIKRFISGALTIALLATSAAVPVYAEDSTEEAIELSTEEEEAVEELSTEEVVEELSTEVIEEEQSTEELATEEDSIEESTEEDPIEESTGESIEEPTSAVDDEIIEVETDTKTANGFEYPTCVGTKKLVVGKTYTVKLGKNEEYWFNNIPLSDDNNAYFAVLTQPSGTDYEKMNDICAFVVEGTWSDYKSMSDAGAKQITKGDFAFSPMRA